jgi:hypothetical protein
MNSLFLGIGVGIIITLIIIGIIVYYFFRMLGGK